MIERHQIINYLIEKYGYKSYLEIGMDEPDRNFIYIRCNKKEAIDPYVNMDGTKRQIPERIKKVLTYPMTSDEAFASMPKSKKYDIIFIDGLHFDEQVARDLYNSMHHLSDNGVIVMHDNLPDCEKTQEWPWVSAGNWTGNTWKTLPTIAKMCDIKYDVIDTDWGVGIVPKQKLNFNPKDYKSDFEWKDFVERRNELMHVISVTEFLAKY